MQLAVQVFFAVLVPVAAVALIAHFINKSAAANAGPGGTDKRA